MKTTDNQYIIEFERKPCRILNKDFQYICKIRFKNIFGMLLRELTFHENHIVIMLSLLYEYIEFGSTNLSASFDTDYNMDLDSMCIIKINRFILVKSIPCYSSIIRCKSA